MTYADVLDAHDKGRYHIAPYRKSRNLGYSGTDLSYGAGVPISNYYASTPMIQNTLPYNEGIFHGGGVDKYLHKITFHQSAASNGIFQLLDYIAYIPFIDGDSTDAQIPTVFDLPRYSDGKGVQAMLISQGQGVASTNCIMTYTNSDGVSGRTASTYLNGGVASGFHAIDRSSFMQLQQGDIGISKIESIRFPASIGGIYTLVLVIPIVSIGVSDTLAPIEIDYFAGKMDMPKIHKDAHLNFLAKFNATSSPNIQAQLEFIW